MPSKPETPWTPRPVPLLKAPEVVYYDSPAAKKQRDTGRITRGGLKHGTAESIALACIADTEAFDDFIFTGDEHPTRGKQPANSAEASASQLFARRCRERAQRQALAADISEKDLARAFEVARRSMRDTQVTRPFFPEHAFFHHAAL